MLLLSYYLLGVVLICLDYGVQEGNAARECDFGREEPLQHARERGGGRPWVSAPGHGASARGKAPVQTPGRALRVFPRQPLPGSPPGRAFRERGRGTRRIASAEQVREGLGARGSWRGPESTAAPLRGPPSSARRAAVSAVRGGRHWMEKAGEGTGFRSVVSRSDCARRATAGSA